MLDEEDRAQAEGGRQQAVARRAPLLAPAAGGADRPSAGGAMANGPVSGTSPEVGDRSRQSGLPFMSLALVAAAALGLLAFMARRNGRRS